MNQQYRPVLVSLGNATEAYAQIVSSAICDYRNKTNAALDGDIAWALTDASVCKNELETVAEAFRRAHKAREHHNASFGVAFARGVAKFVASGGSRRYTLSIAVFIAASEEEPLGFALVHNAPTGVAERLEGSVNDAYLSLCTREAPETSLLHDAANVTIHAWATAVEAEELPTDVVEELLL